MSAVRGKRRRLSGVVKSAKMQNTVVVEIVKRERHPVFEKVIQRRTKVYAHVEGEPLSEGQKVEIVECRPLSKLKRWLVVRAE